MIGSGKAASRVVIALLLLLAAIHPARARPGQANPHNPQREPAPERSKQIQPSGRAAEPEGVTSHLGSGYAALKSDRYDQAVAEFSAALAIDPKLALRARFPLAVALFELQKPLEARREFLAVRAAVGDRPDLAYYIGRLDLVQGNPPQAVKELSQAASRPPFPDTAYYLGSAYLKNGQLDFAQKWLETAAEVTPDDAHVEERLAQLYRQRGLSQQSEKALAKAEGLRQDEAATAKLRIDCARKLESGALQEARPVCDRLFDPDNAVKLTILGTLYGASGDYRDALRPLQRAAEIGPKSPQMQYNVALAYFRLGRFGDARTALEQVAKLWPDLAQIQVLLGASLFKLADQ